MEKNGLNNKMKKKNDMRKETEEERRAETEQRTKHRKNYVQFVKYKITERNGGLKPCQIA